MSRPTLDGTLSFGDEEAVAYFIEADRILRGL